eukprot:scaffold100854_cov36-Attheya_sp.AAC.1
MAATIAALVGTKAAEEAAEDDATQAANKAPEEVTKAVEDKTAARLLEEDSVAIVDGMGSAEWKAAVKVPLAELKAKALNKGALTGTSALIAEEKEVSSDSVTERLAVDEAAAKATEEDLLRSLQQTVSSDSHDSDTKTDSDTSPQDPRAHAGKDDTTAELVQKLAEEDLIQKESPVKSPPVKSPTK